MALVKITNVSQKRYTDGKSITLNPGASTEVDEAEAARLQKQYPGQFAIGDEQSGAGNASDAKPRGKAKGKK